MIPIPKMTGLQFLVLSLLFDGPKAGRELRRELQEHQAPMNRSSFSQLMRRLERSGLVRGDSVPTALDDRTHYHRVYCATVTGLATWREVRAYYAGFPDPGQCATEHLFDDATDTADTEQFRAQLIQIGQAYIEKLKQ